MRGTRSLRSRLTWAFASLLAATVLVGLAGILTLERATASAERLALGLTPAYDENTLAGDHVHAAAEAIGSPTAATTVRAECRGALAASSRVALLDDPQLRSLGAAQTREITTWCRAAQAAATDSGPAPAGQPGVQPPGTERVQAANREVERWLTAERVRARAELRLLRPAGLAGLAVVTVLLLGGGVLFGSRLLRSVVGPLQDVVETLHRLRTQDLTARATPGGAREIRALGEAVNALAEEGDRLREQSLHVETLRAATLAARNRIWETLGTQEVLDVTAEALADVVGVDRVWIRCLDPLGRGRVNAQWQAAGLDPLAGPFTDPERTEPMLGPGWDAMRGAAELCPDVTTSRLTDSAAGRELLAVTGARAMIQAPAVGPDRVMAGVTLADTGGPRTFTDLERECVEILCRTLAQALTQSELFDTQAQLVDQLQGLDRQKNDFVSTVTHELRTPLASMLGYTESVLDGDGGEIPPEAERMLRVVERNARRLAGLIEDLLSLSRIERQDAAPAHRPHQLGGPLEAALDAITPLARDKGLTVTASPADVVVLVDAHHLERALVNVLSNAVKFTPDGGRIDVTVHTADGRVRIDVQDSGIGIAPADLENVFTRFFRASNAVARSIPGTGLGLTLVRDILETFGGTVTLSSTPGVGTRVTLELPVHEPSPDEAAQGRSAL